MRRFKEETGFTLLEVMISLAIVGGLLMTLIYTLNYHLGITERQFVITRMTSLAKAKIREMENSPQAGEGRFPEPDQELHYNTEIKDSHFPEMSEIVVTVETGKERIVLAELMRKRK
jgi:general secretion pathway protein I